LFVYPGAFSFCQPASNNCTRTPPTAGGPLNKRKTAMKSVRTNTHGWSLSYYPGHHASADAIQSIPDLVTTAKGPGGPLTSRPTIAPREAIKAHSHFAQGSELHFRDRPALIASGGQLLVTIVDEVAFSTGCGNSAGRCNSCRRGGPSSRIDCTAA